LVSLAHLDHIQQLWDIMHRLLSLRMSLVHIAITQIEDTTINNSYHNNLTINRYILILVTWGSRLLLEDESFCCYCVLSSSNLPPLDSSLLSSILLFFSLLLKWASLLGLQRCHPSSTPLTHPLHLYLLQLYNATNLEINNQPYTTQDGIYIIHIDVSPLCFYYYRFISFQLNDS